MPTLIDPENIYPRKLGLYRESNLVLEYYNFETDKIKRHVIPFSISESASKNVELIMKNPKHAVFLKKVSIEHLEQVLIGSSFLLPSDINQESKNSF